jgi:hypothetical protein
LDLPLLPALLKTRLGDITIVTTLPSHLLQIYRHIQGRLVIHQPC